MATIDENTQEVLNVTKESLKFLYKFMERQNYKRLEKESKVNIQALEKRHPSKVKIADIEREDINRFLQKAEENQIKCFSINEMENSDLSNLRYSLDDEYKIIEIFKEIQIEKELGNEKDLLDVDFDKLKKDLEKYTEKVVDNKSFDKTVNDLVKEEGIQKVNKLLNLSKNTLNENEKQAAKLKAQEMLEKYKLTMKDVENYNNKIKVKDDKALYLKNNKIPKKKLKDIEKEVRPMVEKENEKYLHEKDHKRNRGHLER